jgi:tetratricopeptide (TPR) repeat protein
LPESDEGDDFSLDDLSIDEFSEEEAEPSVPPDEPPEEESPAGDLDEFPPEEPPVEEMEFSLDDMDFGEPDETEPAETEPGTSDEDSDTVCELYELEDLEELEEDTSEEEISIPDVGAAVEGLGDVDEMAEGGETELSLDDDMNFEEEIGVDILSDMREMGDESHQFSMDDFGEQYNFKEGEAGFADELGVDLEKLEQNIEDVTEEETEKFSLDEEDFRDIRRTLASLPRNLKIAIEEVLADDRWSADDIKPLIDGLIDGESPKSLAARFKTITRRRIELPRSYEKRSGQALEARRAALAYRLLREGWPVVRTILVVISVVWVLGAVSFMWIYRPIHAEKLYRQGLESISVDEVEEGVDSFYDAWDGWPLFRNEEVSGDRIGDAPVVVKGWKNNTRWLDYARSLRRRKHWDSATRFYEGYLTIKPGDKDIRLEYADFLSRVLGQYSRAVTVLEDAPVSGRRKYDRDYTLAAGDVYMDWAEDDPSKFEEARFRYAKVLETSRNDERAILSMMRYHLRLADQDEIETLLPIFDHEVPGKTQEPSLAAEVFAGLGEYQLRRGNLERSRRFIDLGLAADPLAAEPSFVDAAYWRTAGNEQRELSALRRTLVNLEGIESLSRRDLEMRILTLGGMGRVQADRSYRFTEDPSAAAESRSLAMNNYSKALDLYEDAVERNQLGAAPEYGRLYMELGDILYRGSRSAGDLSFIMSETPETYQAGSERYTELLRAEEYYNRAETLYDRGDGTSRLPDETLYRRAYIRYTLNRGDSLVDFYRVARRRPERLRRQISFGDVSSGRRGLRGIQESICPDTGASG